MSTSPEKDLHSVYIDGEMPENFISKYEEEISSNAESKKQLEKMKALHNLLQEDAKAKTADDTFREQSFARLKTKMSYSKTLHAAEKPSYILSFSKYAASFAATAAVFAAVFIPVYKNGISSVQTNEVAAIEIKNETEIQPISEKQVVVDGSLQRTNLTSRIAVSSEENTVVAEAEKSSEDTLPAASSASFIEQKTVRASAMVSAGSSSRQFNLPSVDPFRPDFSSSRMVYSIPKFGEISDNPNQ